MTQIYGTNKNEETIQQQFRNGNIPVAVYGLGKIGLPLAVIYADVCGNVVGADIDETVVERVSDGQNVIKNEPGLDDLVSQMVADGALRATADPTVAAAEATIHVIIVPTLVSNDGEPDLSILESVARDIGSGLNVGDLVHIECTVPPRTARDLVVPIIKETSSLGGDEFGVAVCPERASSGRILGDLRGAYPKVVGGVDSESTRVAAAVYRIVQNNEVIEVSDATTAEAVKVFEGIYRDVNIALANELATFTDELDISVNEAIEVANTQPFCDIHMPGAGVGGHCIPYYPYFIIAPFEADAPLIRTARRVNDRMPEFCANRLCDEMSQAGINLAEATVAILGLTYRAGVEETRATPAKPIADRLDEVCGDVVTVDPILDDVSGFPGRPVSVENILNEPLDGAILVTAHDEFSVIPWDALDQEIVLVDGRQALPRDLRHTVYTVGGRPRDE
jgi:UDP-N-acetyl-D-mannosaminuronic acid dehydrogenase